MRHRDLISINARFFGATMRRLSYHFAAEGGEGGDAGAGGGAGGDAAPKTYTEADIAALKAKNAELIGKNKTLTPFAKLAEGGKTVEEIIADQEFAAKVREEKAREAGQLDEWKKQVTEKSAKEIAAERERAARYSAKLYDVMAKREAEAAITAAGGNPKVLLPHILPFIKVVESDGDFMPQVVDAKGSPRIADSQGSAMTIAQLVDTFKTDDTFGIAFAASGASGSGARNESAGRGGNATVIIPKDATPQEYRRLKADAEKRGVPYAIAS